MGGVNIEGDGVAHGYQWTRHGDQFPQYMKEKNDNGSKGRNQYLVSVSTDLV